MNIQHIGITGGIGSGKSTIGRIFTSLGYRLYHADARAKQLMVENPVIMSGVKTLFGEQAYLEDGSLNRKLIGQIVFNDQKLLQQLNSIVHPETGKDYLAWVQTTPKTYSKSFMLKEAAILYESGAYLLSDSVMSVYAPKELRIKRVMARDKVDRQTVLGRMSKQWNEVEKLRRAEFAFINDGKHALIPQVLAAIRYFEGKAESAISKSGK